MKKVNKIQIFNLVIFVAYFILFAFEIVKVCYYSSHRELWSADYDEIINSIIFLTFFVLCFIFSTLFLYKNKFRKTAFAFYCACSVLSVAKIIKNSITFSRLFFATESYTPLFIDKFTSLFELCFICLFAILFISYFVYLFKKDKFKKSP